MTVEDREFGELINAVKGLTDEVRALRDWRHDLAKDTMPILLAAGKLLSLMDGRIIALGDRLTDIEKAMQISRGARSVVVVVAEKLWPILPALLVWWATKR